MRPAGRLGLAKDCALGLAAARRLTPARRLPAPGGKLVVHYHEKLGQAPNCGDCGVRLHGVRRRP